MSINTDASNGHLKMMRKSKRCLVFSISIAVTVLAASACNSTNESTVNTVPSADDGGDSVTTVFDSEVTNKASRVIADYTALLDQHGVTEGAIAVSYNGELVDSAGINRQAEDNAPVASLSKAITAVCTMKALRSRNLEPSVTLREVMPDTLSGLDIQDNRLPDISIEQLLLHNSGIHTAHISVLGIDIPTMRLEQKYWQLEFIARDGLSAEPGSGYFYANANYLILGLAIEAMVDDDYQSWCQREVLMPLGIDTAVLSPLWTVLSSFGGWEISAVDYLTFVDAYFEADNMAGLDPASSEVFVSTDGSARYGLGTLFRLTSEGAIYWHSGSFTWQSAEQSGRFGAYFTAFPNGFSATVNLSDSLDDGRGSEIDRLLFQLAE